MKALVDKTNMLKTIEFEGHLYTGHKDATSDENNPYCIRVGYEKDGITLGSKIKDYLLGDGEDPAIVFLSDEYRAGVHFLTDEDGYLFFGNADDPDDPGYASSDGFYDLDAFGDDDPFPQYPINSLDSPEADEATNLMALDILHDHHQAPALEECDEFTNFDDSEGIELVDFDSDIDIDFDEDNPPPDWYQYPCLGPNIIGE